MKQEYSNNCQNISNSSSEKKNSLNSSFEGDRSRSRERSRKRSRRERSFSSSQSSTRSKSQDRKKCRHYEKRDRDDSSRSRSISVSKRIRYYGTRECPDKSKVLGVFGLSSRTIEDDLVDVFCRYGPLKDVRIIYDAKTRYSRGFGFITFDCIEDASKARRHCNGMRMDGKRIRVDYSITRRAHTPTPGIYMGHRSESKYSKRRYRSDEYRRRSRHRRSHSTSR